MKGGNSVVLGHTNPRGEKIVAADTGEKLLEATSTLAAATAQQCP